VDRGARHAEVADELRTRLAAHEWPVGAALPRLEDLALQYSTSRSTVSTAMKTLRDEGLVLMRPGAASSVLRWPETASPETDVLAELMAAQRALSRAIEWCKLHGLQSPPANP
jgi:DNA-binding FadR family transcriptional regulator